MASAQELYDRWKQSCPTEVSVGDFRKVLYEFLGLWTREKTGTSHVFIVEHPALASASAFGGHDIVSFPVKSGRRVKGIYVQRLLKAIECVQS